MNCVISAANLYLTAAKDMEWGGGSMFEGQFVTDS